ncbi:MAG: MotA/TolQ/ExbB proton channel family protein [Opitutaceae bacterium]
MSAIVELLYQGGPVMVVLVVLSVVLYERCINLLILLRRTRRSVKTEFRVGVADLPRLRRQAANLHETYSRHRTSIGALIAVAPLLGLLGTVIGMVSTFKSLAATSAGQSIEGLAGGISMALVTTETGLGIAIPALIILYYAQREFQENTLNLNQLESEIMERM